MSYEGMFAPFETVPFVEMKKKQAEQYLAWYIDTMEERMRNLERYINSTGTHMVLDKTPDSLVELWDWFTRQIEVCTKSDEELEEEIRRRPDWMKENLLRDRRKFSTSTAWLIYDISAYLGEVLVTNNPGIRWGYLSKPKKLYGVNHPRLLGFAGDMSVYTYGQVEVCTWRTIRTAPDKLELFHTYQICVNMI